MTDERSRIEYAGISDQGMIRPDNQDSYGAFPDGQRDIAGPKGLLFLVADGMGGHKGGKYASSLAVETISESYFADENSNTGTCLRTAVLKANAAIKERSVLDPDYINMGTTCSVLVLCDGHGVIAHVGDSRIYRVSRNGIEQLTNDHSTVAEMIRRGMLTKEEAVTHPERSHVYRAVGVREDLDVDVIDGISLGRNDFFVLCSDGLVNHVGDDEIMKEVLARGVKDAADELVRLANERGGSDNITVQIINVNPTESFLGRLFGKTNK